jgi:hypothetical protein
MWLVLAIAVSVRTLLRPTSHTTFPVLAGGAAHWWTDQSLYADYRPDLDYFRYPPAFAIFLTPFAWLGPRLGGVLWALVNLGVFGCGLWRFRRDVLPRDWSPARQAIFLALAGVAGLRAIWNSQCNVLTVGLVLLGVAALARRHWNASAGWLGASLLVKLTPLPLVMLLAALWPRKLIVRLALVLAVGLLVPFLTRPAGQVLEQYRSFAAQLRATSAERWPGFRDAWTVCLVVADWSDGVNEPLPLLAPLDEPGYRQAQLLTAAAVLAWCLLWQRRGARNQELLLGTLALGSAWLLIFGPAVEHATYVFLAPSLAWALSDSRRARGDCLLAPAAVLILVLGWGSLTRPWQHAFPAVMAALPVGTILFALWAVVYGVSARRGQVAMWTGYTTAGYRPRGRGVATVASANVKPRRLPAQHGAGRGMAV